jgi:hypothetical protein
MTEGENPLAPFFFFAVQHPSPPEKTSLANPSI